MQYINSIYPDGLSLLLPSYQMHGVQPKYTKDWTVLAVPPVKYNLMDVTVWQQGAVSIFISKHLHSLAWWEVKTNIELQVYGFIKDINKFLGSYLQEYAKNQQVLQTALFLSWKQRLLTMVSGVTVTITTVNYYLLHYYHYQILGSCKLNHCNHLWILK